MKCHLQGMVLEKWNDLLYQLHQCFVIRQFACVKQEKIIQLFAGIFDGHLLKLFTRQPVAYALLQLTNVCESAISTREMIIPVCEDYQSKGVIMENLVATLKKNRQTYWKQTANAKDIRVISKHLSKKMDALKE